MLLVRLTNSAVRGFLLMQALLLGTFMVQLLTGFASDDPAAAIALTTCLSSVLAAIGGWHMGRIHEPAATILIGCAIPLLIGALLALWAFTAASVALTAGFLVARRIHRAGTEYAPDDELMPE